MKQMTIRSRCDRRCWPALPLLLAVLGLVPGPAAPAAEPVVSGVLVEQATDGSSPVSVTYDLADADSDSVAVALQLSVDGGATWDFPVYAPSGDIGPAIAPGAGKQIVLPLGDVDRQLDYETFRARVIASDAGVQFRPHLPSHVAVVDLSIVDWSDPATIESFARADLLTVMASALWHGGGFDDVDVCSQLRALNPDITIIGYVSAKSAQLWATNPSADLFWREWLERTRPYWAYTTQGDTVQDFDNNVVLNILDPDCRRTQIETIVEFHRASLNQLDGVYWDYFNNSLWIPDWLDVEGDPDLDQDGISHYVDADELLAYQAACTDLVVALRDSLGEDFVQIFNGQRAYGDSTFAALADGVMYELYPILFFPDPDLQTSLDPDYPFNLFAVRRWLRDRNGGPFVVLSYPGTSRYYDHQGQLTLISTGDQYRAVALIADLYAAWHEGIGSQLYVYGWPDNDLCLGQPLGPVQITGDFLRRDFQYGRVEIELTSGAYPDPFDYRIWVFDELFEELAIPYHYP